MYIKITNLFAFIRILVREVSPIENIAGSNWNMEVDFCGRRKTGELGENPQSTRQVKVNI